VVAFRRHFGRNRARDLDEEPFVAFVVDAAANVFDAFFDIVCAVILAQFGRLELQRIEVHAQCTMNTASMGRSSRSRCGRRRRGAPDPTGRRKSPVRRRCDDVSASAVLPFASVTPVTCPSFVLIFVTAALVWIFPPRAVMF
jgi:hypothetical protein